MLRRISAIIFRSNNGLISKKTIFILLLSFSFVIYIALHFEARRGYKNGYNNGLHDFSKGLSYQPNRRRLIRDRFFESTLKYREGYKEGYYKYSKKGLPKIVNGMSQKAVLDRFGEPMRKTKVNVGNSAREVWIYPMDVFIFENGIVILGSNDSKSD